MDFTIPKNKKALDDTLTDLSNMTLEELELEIDRLIDDPRTQAIHYAKNLQLEME